MKKEDIEKAQEGELEKVTGFNYVSGKGFASFSREPSGEEQRQEVVDRAEAGQCARCEKPVGEDQEFCPNCGARQIHNKKGD